MPAYDNYDEIDELLSSWAPLFGTIKTRKMRRPASRPGEPPAFCVVKSFILDDEPTLSAIEEQSEVFAAWDAQKRAASSKGAQHIAPILRLERAGEREIWQERGWYSASLQDLVRGDIPLKHEELLHVARSIVAGLRELRDGADGRSHGRLELANVVVGTGEPIDELDLAQAPVFLTDPLPVDLKHTFQKEQADLKALGEIIGQLAERNTTFFFKSAAIMASDKWLELGKHSQRWEEICKRLLEGKSAPTEKSALDELANELDEWARPGVRDKLRVLANRAGEWFNRNRTNLQKSWPGLKTVWLGLKAWILKGLQKVRSHQKALRGLALVAAGLALVAALVSLANKASPRIIRQPQDQQVQEGEQAPFGVTALGLPPPRYQWRVNGTNVPGQTDSTLNLRATNEVPLEIDVVVSSGSRQARSLPAKLSLAVQPARIVSAPTGVIKLRFDDTTNLEVRAEGTRPIFYQWSKGETVLGTNFSLPLLLKASDDAGSYSVVVWNRTATNECFFTLERIGQPPGSVTLSLSTNVVDEGQSVVFTASSETVPRLHYSWFKDHQKLSDWGNASQHILTNASAKDMGKYMVLISNSDGTKTSNVKELTVIEKPVPPVFVEPMQNVAIKAGRDASFRVKVRGTKPIVLQWYSGREAGRVVPIAGQTKEELVLTNVNIPNALLYSVVASNSAGRSRSEARLQIVPTIVKGLTGMTNVTGSQIRLSVEVQSSSPINYHWTTPLLDKRELTLTNSLTLDNAQTNDSGGYSVIVSNELGSEIAQAYLLITNGPPVYVKKPEIEAGASNQLILFHESRTFRILVAGSPGILMRTSSVDSSKAREIKVSAAAGYVWKLNGQEIATSADYSITNATIRDAGIYEVIAVNGASSSDPVSFKVWIGLTNALGMTFVWTGGDLNLFVGETEVSRGQCRMVGIGPQDWTNNDLPANGLSCENALDLCARMNANKNWAVLDGWQYDLPTCDQWRSYAGLGTGINYPANVSPELWLGEVFYIDDKSKPRPVNQFGRFRNGFGLYDVLGNVRESSQGRNVSGWSFMVATNSYFNGACRGQDANNPDQGVRLVLRPLQANR